jgi:hypothetical protein
MKNSKSEGVPTAPDMEADWHAGAAIDKKATAKFF